MNIIDRLEKLGRLLKRKLVHNITLLTILFLGITVTPLFADRQSPKAGDIISFFSLNRVFQADVILQPIIIDSPSEVIYKKEGVILWKKKLPSTPGFVNISDDGKYIVMANWGWYDEGGFKDLTFYDGNGNLLREIKFAHPGRWIGKTKMSSNGQKYSVANNGKEHAEITLYDVTNQRELWSKNVGLESLGDIAISRDGAHILVSTYNLNCKKSWFFITVCDSPKDAEFTYLDISGNLIWSQRLENGYGWNQDFIDLSEDGVSFKVYDLKNKRWVSFAYQGGVVTPASS